jgi:hypothetical protein
MMVVLLMVICWTGGCGGGTTKVGGRTHGLGPEKNVITGAGRKNAPGGGGGGGSLTNSTGRGGQKNAGIGGGGTNTGSLNTICGWAR